MPQETPFPIGSTVFANKNITFGDLFLGSVKRHSPRAPYYAQGTSGKVMRYVEETASSGLTVSILFENGEDWLAKPEWFIPMPAWTYEQLRMLMAFTIGAMSDGEMLDAIVTALGIGESNALALRGVLESVNPHLYKVVNEQLASSRFQYDASKNDE